MTSKHMKKLAGSSKSYQEDRSIDAIHTEKEREFCDNCRKQPPKEQMSSLQYVMFKNVAKLIIGNLSAGLANGNNSTKEQSQSSRK